MSVRARANIGAFLAAVLSLSAAAADAGTLDAVRQRGTLLCGVNPGLAGFAARDANGVWSGFDVDFCRAVAAAALGDAAKVAFVPLSAADRFEALRAGKIDLLSRNSTWTLEREAGLGILFAGITYHDGQGFLVPRNSQIASVLELDGAKVCVQAATTSHDNLADFFRANSMRYEEKSYVSLAEALKAYVDGVCSALTADHSALYALRLGLPKPADAIVLPDVVSKEPLGLAVRADDPVWFNVVKWVNFALINGEELGVTAANVEEARASTKPAVRRLLGADGDVAGKFALDAAWAYRALKATGNYAEIYERNVGSKSRLGIPRGLNQLWSMGGILYAPPLH